MTKNGKEILESFGVVFGEVVEDDPMFQYAELPEGWTRARTEHSMHSDVLDGKGRKRIGVFYKAAFYDRSAHLTVCKRYGYSQDYLRRDEEKIYVANVTDDGGDMPIYTTDPIPYPELGGDWDAYDKTNNDALLGLRSHHDKTASDWQHYSKAETGCI